MLEYLQVIATSWPITCMVVAIVGATVANSRIKQAQDDSQAVRDLRASNAVVRTARGDE